MNVRILGKLKAGHDLKVTRVNDGHVGHYPDLPPTDIRRPVLQQDLGACLRH